MQSKMPHGTLGGHSGAIKLPLHRGRMRNCLKIPQSIAAPCESVKKSLAVVKLLWPCSGRA